MNLTQISRTGWILVSISAGIISGAAAGVIAWEASDGKLLVCSAGVLLGSILAIVPTLLFGNITIKFNDLRERVDRDHTSIRELVNIRPLLDGPPLDYGHWAMDTHLGKILAQIIALYKPTCIVECGSGTSTVFMSQVASRFIPSYRLIALDHLGGYASKTRDLLENHGCGGGTEVVNAPLRSWSIGGDQVQWYDVDLDRFPEGSIDLLVVDGPPSEQNSRARYPAVPILKSYLSQECLIVMDDTNRPGERSIAREWAEILNAEIEDVGGPKGTCILRRRSKEDSHEKVGSTLDPTGSI